MTQQSKYSGKVRDIYDRGDELLIVVSDRLSGFDRQLALIPGKGVLLNRLSAWWFERTRHIIANHMLDVPAANSMRVTKCRVFPVEFVVRGYITGSTSTSLWTQYNEGVRDYCGHRLSDGLLKNQQLSQAILTPTTKSADHDQPITATEIVAQGLMTQGLWDEAAAKVLALYDFGVKCAADKGLILVDSKYELGLDSSDNIVLVDELHTPDSSRYWAADTYVDCFERGLEPTSFDKEFIRLWVKAHCDPYQDEVLPALPQELIDEMLRRYQLLYQKLAGDCV